jgi:DNA-binding CsgD family transcriptional regulator
MKNIRPAPQSARRAETRTGTRHFNRQTKRHRRRDQACKRMLEQGMDTAKIAEATGLSINEIKKLQQGQGTCPFAHLKSFIPIVFLKSCLNFSRSSSVNAFGPFVRFPLFLSIALR